MIDLQKEWFDLTKDCKCNENIKTEIFEDIYKKYSSKKRAYHNTRHIEALLTIINDFSEQIKDIESVKYSVWFHDVIYHAWKKDNEEQSAKFAIKAMMKLGIDNEKVEKVSQFILLTKEHNSFSNNFDEKLFLDSDLSILGVAPDIYKIYTQNIRKEYFFVPQPLYHKGRIAVLKHFLQMENIYKTTQMRDKLENQAIDNLKNELKILESV